MDTTAVKALRSLEWLCQHDGAVGVTELAQALGVTKSNAHRTLRTLTSLGYAACPEPGTYVATLKMWEVGSAVLARSDVKEVAHPVLAELSARSGESVHLSILDGNEVVYIDKVESNQPIRAYSRIGGRAPAYAVATGKVLLAFSSGELRDLLPKKPEAYTRLTLTRTAEIEAAAEETRRRGYAVNRGEWREDVCGIAAPIRNHRAEVIAALGISGPRTRLTAERMARVAGDVVDCAEEISRRLGYSSPARRSARPAAPAKRRTVAAPK